MKTNLPFFPLDLTRSRAFRICNESPRNQEKDGPHDAPSSPPYPASMSHAYLLPQLHPTHLTLPRSPSVCIPFWDGALPIEPYLSPLPRPLVISSPVLPSTISSGSHGHGVNTSGSQQNCMLSRPHSRCILSLTSRFGCPCLLDLCVWMVRSFV